MQCTMNAALLASVLAVVMGATYEMDYSTDASPVKQVIQLMNAMVENGKKEIQAEKVQYSTYSEWCETTEAKKSKAISDAADKIDELQGDIEKVGTTIDKLSAEISSHQSEVESLKAEQEKITQIRKTEEADFKASQKDYEESIDACSRAVVTLKKQAYDRKQADEPKEEEAFLQSSSLAQLSTKAPPKEVKAAVTAFLQTSQGQLPKAPKVDGYEFQSQGIISLLSELQDKFQAEKVDLEKEEFAKLSNYETTFAGLKNEEDIAQKDLDKKVALKSKKEQRKAELSDDFKLTSDQKAADEKYLDEVSTTCDQKASDFKARQKLRAEELEAVEKAIEVVSGEAVSGNEEKHLWKNQQSFLQVNGTVLAVLRGRGHERFEQMQEKISEFLQTEATRLQSKRLQKAAAAAGKAPAMVTIKNMLEELLDDLQKQHLEEQTKKNYCDKELKTNKMARAEQTARSDELSADIDMLKASINQLIEETEQLKSDVAELDATVKNATDIRNAEKMKNNETIQDAQAAQAAVAQAISVLKDFYDRAAQATALVQEKAADSSLSFLQKSEQPAIFDSPYRGMGGENGGVIDMMEVIASDFAKLESETKSEEESSADEYKKLMDDSKFNKKQMETDIKHKEEVTAEQTADSEEKSNELQNVNQELNASIEVFETLKDECINTAKSYEEEQAQRAAMIKSLQEALEMLTNNPVNR
eukprot:TRINITY_DN6439_c0_g2_i1.p1 TRINITY_DN6439_c0_g2~~TRINITY_DN6439_c0_g2_i1.p1  ORF type:complete len:703 (-),score=281.69 TRINITY_DN6439_c0_g2_i1:31-2139(-)